MATTYKAFANAAPQAVSNTEVVVTSKGTVPASSLAVGDVIRVRLVGTLDPSQWYNLNVRLGANGNTGDQVIYNSNNQISQTVLQSDLNSWATAFPGGTPGQYAFPQVPSNATGVTNTPAKIDGELHLVVTAQAGNTCNLSVVVPATQPSMTSLLSSLGSGVLAANVVVTSYNVNSNITVTMSAQGMGSYGWLGVGQGDASTPELGWHYSAAANSGKSLVTYSLIELM